MVSPRVVLPLSAALLRILELAIGLLILIGLVVYYAEIPAWTAVFLPFVFAIQLAFTIGLSLLLSARSVFVRDVNHVLPVALGGYMFCTAVVYPMLSCEGIWKSFRRGWLGLGAGPMTDTDCPGSRHVQEFARFSAIFFV